MKKLAVLAFMAIVAVLSPLSLAEVTLTIDGYNSMDSTSTSVNGDGMNYGGLLYFDSDKMIFQNVGSSTSDDGSYSTIFSFNDATVHSSAATQSGKFSWKGGATTLAGGIASPAKSFDFQAVNYIDSGTLKSSFGNDQVSVDNYVKAVGAQYSESINLGAGGVGWKGGGSTPNPDFSMPQSRPAPDVKVDYDIGDIYMNNNILHGQNGPSDTNSEDEIDPGVLYGPSSDDASANQGTDPNIATIDTNIDTASTPSGDQTPSQDEKGFIQHLKVQGKNDWGQIDAEILGDTSTSWSCGAATKGSDISLGLSVQGMSSDVMNKLQMAGQGSDIPLQLLPALSVKIGVALDPSDKDWKLFEQYASAEKNAFNGEYPSSAAPWFYFYSDQIVNSGNEGAESSHDAEDSTKLTPEVFKMNMGFYIKGNK